MIEPCRHCGHEIVVVLDKDRVLRWHHTDTGASTCPRMFAEPTPSRR